MTRRSMTVHQVSRPHGQPTTENFAFVEDALPKPTPGTALVENIYLSVDPYMRECMDALWDLHAPLEGRSIDRVVNSQDSRLAVGDLVFHRNRWRTHALVPPPAVRFLPQVPRIPPTPYLNI